MSPIRVTSHDEGMAGSWHYFSWRDRAASFWPTLMLERLTWGFNPSKSDLTEETDMGQDGFPCSQELSSRTGAMADFGEAFS
jgi:hypothetical protein